MAYLFAKKSGYNISAQQLVDITQGESFSEIGVCNASNGELCRIAGDLTDVEHAVYNTEKEAASLLYFDNPKKLYSPEHFSPVGVSHDMAFACCGEMLALRDSDADQSNNGVFVAQTIYKIWNINPKLLFTPQFDWLFMKVARSFVGAAIINSSGVIHFYNEHLFISEKGFKYMDSEKAEKDATTSWRKPDLKEILASSKKKLAV